MVGTDHVRPVVLLEIAPDAGLRRDVKDDVAAGRGAEHGVRVGEVAAHALDTEASEFGIIAPRQTAHRIAAREQLSNDRPAQETAAAGDERLQRTLRAAQTASFSRKIFALWRISTGNDL